MILKSQQWPLGVSQRASGGNQLGRTIGYWDHFSPLNNGQPFRPITGDDGNPWFVAADVCKCLGLGRMAVSDHTRKWDETEKVKYDRTLLGMRQGKPAVLISESGLYKLIMRSDKKEARIFQDWVTKDVLPSIRKTE